MKLVAIEALLVQLKYQEKDEEAYAAACGELREANAELTKLEILDRLTLSQERERVVITKENIDLKRKVTGLGMTINKLKKEKGRKV